MGLWIIENFILNSLDSPLLGTPVHTLPGLLAYAAIFLIIMLLLPRGILPTITDRLRNQRKRGQQEQRRTAASSLQNRVQDAG